MTTIHLDGNDYFLLVRALVFAELKTMRNISDVFGEELLLTKESRFDQVPLTTSSDEKAGMATRVKDYFCLPTDTQNILVQAETLGDWVQLVAERVGSHPQTITFFSSGSTGEPKPIRRQFLHLEQDAEHLARMLQGSKRVISLVAPHHIYGFIYTILVPEVLGIPCLIKRFQPAASLIKEMRSGDVVISIPSLWQLCTETNQHFPPATVGVTSTGPCSPDVIRRLRQQGLAVMHEIYGSSESGAIGYRHSPDDDMTLMPTWTRVGDDRFVRMNADGSASEPFSFQDQLDWKDATHFTVNKRLDHAVQVAGVNVFPSRVRQAILSHDAVADCAVRLMRPEEGNRLKAFVVLKRGVSGDSELVQSLQAHLAARLTVLEQPRSIVIGADLPRNEMGKLADWTIESRSAGMTLQEALQRLTCETVPVPAGQAFQVDRLNSDDPWRLARLLCEEHGVSWQFKTHFIPQHLWREAHSRQVNCVVARTLNGDIVGYASWFRSFAPYQGVFESIPSQVLASYVSDGVPRAIQDALKRELQNDPSVEAVFSEVLPKHRQNEIPSALLLARQAKLLIFHLRSDYTRHLYCPSRYKDILQYLLEALALERTILPAQGAPPIGHLTFVTTDNCPLAKVARLHVQTLGEDFSSTLEAYEHQAGQQGSTLLLVILNLGEAWCHAGVDLLLERGYFFGGLLPRWFDHDGLLMQSVRELPDFKAIQLDSPCAQRLLEFAFFDLVSSPSHNLAQHVNADSSSDLPLLASEISEVSLSGDSLTIEKVVAVARYGVSISHPNPAALARVADSANFIGSAIHNGTPIYGVNTGFGGMSNIAIDDADLVELQNNLLRFLNVGAGDYLSADDVRAAMLLRANSHLRGVSGVRQELIDRLITFLNKGATPLVRDLGSIGASGDLAPLATIAGAVVGADPCFKVAWNGKTMDCLTALAHMDLKPMVLAPKEGLAMVNGTSVMTGIAANCLYDARRLVGLSLSFHALAIQALLGSDQSFHPFIHHHKPHPGQLLTARIMLAQLKGSSMCRHGLEANHSVMDGQPTQDRYSLRCLPQFLGPVLDCLSQARRTLEIEMNSANDNPLIDVENRLSLHSGNFLGQYVAVSMDHLRYCLGLMAKHVDSQIALLVSPEFNGGLPASLVGNPARKVNMGLKGLQIAANSIMPLVSFYGMPIADRFPTHAEQFNQNINSQGFNAATLARKSLRALEAYVAMALVFGVQAVSLRAHQLTGSHDPRPLLSEHSGALYDAIFTVLGPFQVLDRPLIWNDDEQSLEEIVQCLQADIAADGHIIRAVTDVITQLW